MTVIYLTQYPAFSDEQRKMIDWLVEICVDVNFGFDIEINFTFVKATLKLFEAKKFQSSSKLYF